MSYDAVTQSCEYLVTSRVTGCCTPRNCDFNFLEAVCGNQVSRSDDCTDLLDNVWEDEISAGWMCSVVIGVAYLYCHSHGLIMPDIKNG